MRTHTEWVSFLDSELNRRDNRQAFLWAIFISALSLEGALLFRTFPNRPSYPLREWVWLLGLGAATFLAILAPLVQRITGTVQPGQLSERYSPEQSAILGELWGKYGRGRAIVAASWPFAAALVLVACALLAAREGPTTSDVIFNVIGGGLFLLAALMTVVPLVEKKSFLRHSVPDADPDFVGPRASAGLVEIVTRVMREGESSSRDERAQRAMIEYLKANKHRYALSEDTLKRISLITYTLYAILLAWLAWHVIRPYAVNNDVSVAAVQARLELSLLCGLLLAIAVFWRALFLDTSRRLLEQLRAGLFLQRINPTEAAVLHTAIELLRREPLRRYEHLERLRRDLAGIGAAAGEQATL